MCIRDSGKAVKACVLSTKRAAGKEIVTVEGLSEAERCLLYTSRCV